MCRPVLEHLWTQASEACIGKGSGLFCNGGAPPDAEPAAEVAAQLGPVGALVDADTIAALRTPPIQTENASLGIGWLRTRDTRDVEVTLLLVGDVTMWDVTPENFPAWSNILLQTSLTAPRCAAAPQNGIIAQAQGGQAQIGVNGASLVVGGTVLIRTTDTATTFVGLGGRNAVLAVGGRQELLAGQQVSVPFAPPVFNQPSAPPTVPTLFNPALVENLPVALFDRPLILPQPGNVITQGITNLRNAPDIYAAQLAEIRAGEVLTVLGQNANNDWYHVQRENGETGWVYAELLARNVGEITAVYDATPLPPQRYGELGSRGRVTQSGGANLRRGPEVVFPVVALLSEGAMVDLVARSPYMNGWLKVSADGVTGWVASFAIETQAYLDAIPVDWSAPPMPTATPIPGSFGNAFPDPDRDGEGE